MFHDSRITESVCYISVFKPIFTWQLTVKPFIHIDQVVDFWSTQRSIIG